MWPQLIVQYGIPLAFKIWTTFEEGREPTAADWQVLLDLDEKRAAAYVKDAEERAKLVQ